MLIYSIALCLSVTGGTLNLIAIIFLRELRDIALRKMITHFTIADLVILTSFLLRQTVLGDKYVDIHNLDQPKQTIKIVYHMGEAFGLVATQLWTCWLSQYLYCSGNGTFQKQWLKKYTLISYLLGIIASIFTLIMDLVYLFGKEDATHGDLLDSIEATWYNVPFIGAILCCFLFSMGYYISGIRLSCSRRAPIPWVLLLYPLIAIVFPLPKYLITFICFLSTNCTENSQERIWVVVRTLLYLQGFVNALVYGLFGGIQEILKEKCSKKRESASLGTEISSQGLMIESSLREGIDSRLLKTI